MASDKDIVDFIVQQLEPARQVSVKKMFGEYGLYLDGKIVGLICDDQLFMKPTEEGRVFIDDVTLEAPYAGAKAYFLISGERVENSEWLSELVRITAAALPVPKPKKVRVKKAK